MDFQFQGHTIADTHPIARYKCTFFLIKKSSDWSQKMCGSFMWKAQLREKEPEGKKHGVSERDVTDALPPSGRSGRVSGILPVPVCWPEQVLSALPKACWVTLTHCSQPNSLAPGGWERREVESAGWMWGRERRLEDGRAEERQNPSLCSHMREESNLWVESGGMPSEGDV